MSEVEHKQSRQHLSVTRRKKLSTRVDLTPMVDLGFLLITFFIFTTSVAQPVAMNLTMPDDRPAIDPMLASEEKTLTLVACKADRVFFYNGKFTGKLRETTYAANGIRDVIMREKQRIKKVFNTNDMLVLIKVTNEASYKNIVTCLDEMLINDVSTYMLLEASHEEKAATFAK